MSKLIRIVELLLLILLALSTAGFLTFFNLYGVFLALVTSVIAVGVYRRARWGYFACAAWGLACYQLAKQGYEFADVKRSVMLLGVFAIVAAIFLHETLAKKLKPSQQKDEHL